MRTIKEWWNTLSEKDKFEAYKRQVEFAENEARTLNAIVDYLLGKDWIACDTGSYLNVNPIIVETIKAKFPHADKIETKSNWFKKWLLKVF